jgi:predicted metal-dependent peptidase
MASSLLGGVARLRDPNDIVKDPRKMLALQEKLDRVMTRMFRKTENGGNPFLFALCAPKPHWVAVEVGGGPLDTAATDGKNYYWNPDFLAALSEDEASTVMGHESFHVIFHHCDPGRAMGKNPRTFNLALDFSVNGMLDHDHKKSGRSNKYQLWTGKIGPAVTLRELLDYYAGKVDDPPKGCFADPTLYGRSPENIYSEIVEAELKSPRRCKESKGGCGAISMDPKTGKSTLGDGPIDPSKDEGPWSKHACTKCGAPPNYGPGSLDQHLGSKQSRGEVMGDMMRAAAQAEAIGGGRGAVPSEVEAALAELKNPTLSPSVIIQHAFQRKAQDVGAKNDWKRFRRRGLAQTPPVFQPKKHGHLPKWVVCLDTSGSMSDKDIANGLKEMQAVPPPAEGVVVPCDAVPYWDAATKVRSTSDIKRTKIVGRGGTVFDQFFRDLPLKLGTDYDVIVIITDGDCGTINKAYKPACDVLWVITNEREFHPTFGRVCHLKPADR